VIDSNPTSEAGLNHRGYVVSGCQGYHTNHSSNLLQTCANSVHRVVHSPCLALQMPRSHVASMPSRCWMASACATGQTFMLEMATAADPMPRWLGPTALVGQGSHGMRRQSHVVSQHEPTHPYPIICAVTVASSVVQPKITHIHRKPASHMSTSCRCNARLGQSIG